LKKLPESSPNLVTLNVLLLGNDGYLTIFPGPFKDAAVFSDWRPLQK
jgi:hypothetical protein